MKYRILSSVLAAMCIVPALASCGGNTSSEAETTAPVTAVTETATAETTAVKPELPATDMNGTEIHFMAQGWWNYDPLAIDDLMADEVTGEVMNDTVFERQTRIAEQFNCTLKVTAEGNTTTAQNLLNQNIGAGDDVYQVAIIRSKFYNGFLTSGYLADLEKVKYIDLTADWYDAHSLEALAIANRSYGVVSNITMNAYELIFCGYCNKQMMTDYKLGDIYSIVKEGKWTWDKMYSLGKAVSADVDNDGQYTTADRYGFTYIVDVPEGMLNAAGVRYATLDKNGTPTITYSTEDAVTKFQKLMNILQDEKTSMNIHVRSTDPNRDEVGLFINGQALFSLAGIYYAPQFREMKDDFGIIPFPKYDDTQAYSSPMFGYVFPITVIPVTNTKMDYTGMIVEQMSYEGYTELLPALYETILQGKITRDETSNAMLDLIFTSTFYDTGLSFNFGGMVEILRAVYKALDGNFVSTFAENKNAVQANIDDLMAKMK